MCYDELGGNRETGALKCGHTFHLICVNKWLESSKNCPICCTKAGGLRKLYFSEEDSEVAQTDTEDIMKRQTLHIQRAIELRKELERKHEQCIARMESDLKTALVSMREEHWKNAWLRSENVTLKRKYEMMEEDYKKRVGKSPKFEPCTIID